MGATCTAQAAPRIAPRLEPEVVETYSQLSADQSWMLFSQERALLRADGSFGYFPLRYAQPHEDQPMELLTWGGPVPDGTFRSQIIEGGAGGTLPFPGLTVSGVEGYDWVFDDAEWRMPRPGETPDSFSGWVPAEPHLMAIDDRGRVAKRVPLDFGPRTFTRALVPTGAGLRAVIRTDDRGHQVRRSNGTLIAQVPQIGSLRSAIGRPDGSVLLSGYPEAGYARSWSDVVVEVTPRGQVRRLKLGRSRKALKGDLLTALRGGLLVSDEGGFPRQRISRISYAGARVSRKLAHLKLPWSADCLENRVGIDLVWATVGATGNPVVRVNCFRDGDRIEEVLDSFVVGLDSALRARWVAPATTSEPVLGPDGRLFWSQYVGESGSGEERRTAYRLMALREPGAPAPRRGRVVSVRADGDGAVVAIRCSAPVGTVCAGTVRLARRGGESATLPYALRGRPGKNAAVVLRHFDRAPHGAGPLRATLTR